MMKFFKKGFYPTDQQREEITQICNGKVRVLGDGVMTSFSDNETTKEQFKEWMEAVQSKFDCFPKPNPYAQQIRFYEELIANGEAEERDTTNSRTQLAALLKKARAEGYIDEE